MEYEHTKRTGKTDIMVLEDNGKMSMYKTEVLI
jgi:hypothetical protein